MPVQIDVSAIIELKQQMEELLALRHALSVLTAASKRPRASSRMRYRSILTRLVPNYRISACDCVVAERPITASEVRLLLQRSSQDTRTARPPDQVRRTSSRRLPR